MKEPEVKEIVLFDGYCNLCNSSVQFLLRHEKNDALYFASLQSEYGQRLLQQHGLSPEQNNSVVFIKEGKVLLKSSAALHLCKRMKGLYPLLIIFLIIPPFIRNAVYEFVARKRYAWFGRSEQCMIPDEKLKRRFLG